MPIKRVKKVKKTKETVKTVAKAKRKGQAQAQTNIQKVNIRIGGDVKGKKPEEKSNIVVAPTVAPIFHSRTGLSEAHFMPPYPQVKMGNPVIMEQGIKKEQYINNHSGVVVGGNQQQRLFTPSDVFAHNIQPISNFSTVKQPATLDYEAVEEEDHKQGDPLLDQITESTAPSSMPNGEAPKKALVVEKPIFERGKTGPRPEGGNLKSYYRGLIKDWNRQQEDIDGETFKFTYRENGKQKDKGINELKNFVEKYGLQ